MKLKTIIAALLATSISMPYAVFAYNTDLQNGILASEDFENTLSDWYTSNSSQMSIVDDGDNKVCNLTSSVDASAWFESNGWTDYVVKGKVKPVSGKTYFSAGIIVRAIDIDNLIFVRMSGNASSITSVELYKWEGGTPTKIAGSTKTFNYGEWYDFEVTAEYNKISASINGETVFNQVDIPSRFASGTAGIKARYGTAYFDDLEVKEIARDPADTAIYTTASDEYTESGVWESSEFTDYDDSKTIKTSYDNNATATYSFYPPNLARETEANYMIFAWIPKGITSQSVVSYKIRTLNGTWSKGIQQKGYAGGWYPIATVTATGETAIDITMEAKDSSGCVMGSVKAVKTLSAADDQGVVSGGIDTETVAVFANQIGYDIGGIKRATVTNAKDDTEYTVKKAATGETVYTGKISKGVADFSEFNPSEKGEYYVECSNAKSNNFSIEKNLYQKTGVPTALNFMEYSRNDSWLPGRTSIAWRDSHQFSFELPTMIMQYMANPAVFENLERGIYKISDTYFTDLRVQNEPDLIWLMKYGMEWYYQDNTDFVNKLPSAENRSAGHNLHPLIKEQAAYFLYIYPYITDYVTKEEYTKYRDWLISIWGNSDTSNTLAFYAVPGEKYNLFETQTAIGAIKGSFPPGHSIVPNLMMYEVLKRDGIDGSDKYFEAAYNNAKYLIENIDITDPKYTKGQRMSEHILMENLAYFAEMYPDEAPEGLKAAIERWADKMIARSNNIWDLRMASSVAAGDEKDFWTGAAYAYDSGQVTSIMNEPGSEIGFQAAAYAAARVIDDTEKADRLREIGDAGRDNMYGRNPHGRMFLYEATDDEKGIPGADLGWFATHGSEGNGKLAICPGRIDGSPKEGAYPFNPSADYGYVEGWVAYNSCWNAALAYESGNDTKLSVDKTEVNGGETVNITLSAAVNMDSDKEENAFVYLKDNNTGKISKITLAENSKDDDVFSGSYQMPETTGKYDISYGIGNFAVSESIQVNGEDYVPEQPEETEDIPEPQGFKLVDNDFNDPSQSPWGFSKSGSGFDVVAAEDMIQFKGGNTTTSQGVSIFNIPATDIGSVFEISFDVYHPLADSGDTFIRFTDDNNKDVFSLYLRESASTTDIEGKMMRYGFNTSLGSSSLTTGANGSAKYTTTPETGNIGANGVKYRVYSKMDFNTKKQTLIVKNLETGKIVLNIKDAAIKNATSLKNIKIGYGYNTSAYEGVYIDNLVIATTPEKEIFVKDFLMKKGNISSEIVNYSGKDIDVTAAYAVYNTDGSLKSITYKDETISGNIGSNSFVFNGSAEMDEDTVPEAKLFVWEKGTMKPLIDTMVTEDIGNNYNFAAMVQNVPKKNQLLDPGYYTWCGSYIQDKDGKYHVFYSRWKLEYGFVPGWVSHSEIAHAVSDNIDGPYEFKEVILGPRDREYWDGTTSHNPYIIEKDGKYYLYYMGTTAPDGVSETPSSYKADWYEYRNRQQIGVAVADSLDGPWTRFDTPVHGPDKIPNEDGTTKWDSMLVSNPALTLMPDGRILMIYKGVQDTTNGDTSAKNGVVKIGVAIAENPTGPFVKQEKLIFEGAGTLAAEDPFVWYSDKNKKYYAIVRDASKTFTGVEGALALFESTDGITDWQAAKYPLVLGGSITWDDGTVNNSRVERPWLMFDENEEPQMLFGATRINNDESFTTNIFIPLKSE